MNKADLHEKEKKHFITNKFTDHFIRKEEKFPFIKYVEYTIMIKTSLNHSWIIYKRYKCFQKLHQTLSTKLTHLPAFPPKKLFNMTESIISQRKIALEYYLNYILDKVDLIMFPEIIEFIVNEEINRIILLRQIKEPSNLKRDKPIRKSIRKAKSSENLVRFKNNLRSYNPYLSLNNNFTKFVDMFLENLEDEKEDTCHFIKSFWNAFKESKWTNVKREDVIKLFFGNAVVKGLIFHCGRIDDNCLGAEEALLLINKLTQYDFNPDCEQYLGIFRLSKIEHIRQMKLNTHLASNKHVINQACFKLITHLINIEKGINLKNILKDKDLEKKFENWVELQDNI